MQLHASAWLRVLSDLAGYVRRRGAGHSQWNFKRRTAYRLLLAATAALLILVTVFAILVAVLAMLEDGERTARLSAGAAQFTGDRPIVPARSSEVTEASDPIALLLDQEAATELPTAAAAETASPQSAAGEAPASDIQPAIPGRDLPRIARSDIAGVWAPQTGSCSAREGVLPATINERGARAGETSCVFKEQRWTERDFRVLANCTNGHERWTSNVRLIVNGDRMIWTSKRGTQAYTRCKSNI